MMILMMVAALVCAAIILSSATGALLLLPVFAQQEETSLGEREDLGSGIASDVLDSIGVEEDEQGEEENDRPAATGDNDGDTNTQVAIPIIDQDQRAANLAEQRAANLDIEIVRIQPPTQTPGEAEPPGEEPPEF
jgi:hypothetical protein